MIGNNITILKQDKDSYTYQRSTPDGRLVGGRVHSGGKAPQEGSWQRSTFKDSKTGRTLTSTIIGED